MRATLERYVLREVLKVFLVAAAAVAAVVLAAFCMRLMNRGLQPFQLMGALPYILLFATPFAIPCGILIAVVLVFGRMAADNELLAAHAHGISRGRLIAPVLALGVVLTFASFYLNSEVLPVAHYRLSQVGRKTIGPLLDRLGTWTMAMELPSCVVYVAGKAPEDPHAWRSVAVVRYADEIISEIYLAKRGTYSVDEQAQRATIRLEDVRLIVPALGGNVNSVAWSEVKETELPIDMGTGARGDPGSARTLSWSGLAKRLADYRARTAGQARLIAPMVVRRLLAAKVRELQGERDEIATRSQALEKQRTQAATQMGQVAGQIATLTDAQKRLKRLGQDLSQEKAALEETAKRRQEYVDQETDPARRQPLIDKLAEAQQQIKTIDAALASNEAEAAKVTVQLTDLNRPRDEAKASQDALQKQYDGVQSELAAAKAKVQAVQEDLRQAEDQDEEATLVAEMHFRASQSLGALAFILIGIPLGILIHRGSAVVAFGASLAVVLVVYYPLYDLGRLLTSDGYLAPAPAYWMAPAVCIVIGLVLFRLAGRR